MDARDRGRLHALADAAVRLHTAPPAMTVQGETPARTLKLLRDAAPAFPVAVLPALGRDARLLGGGMTSLDGAPVAFTRWEKCGRVYTLLQFMPNQEGLRAEFPQTVEESPTRSPAGKPYAVAFWPNTMMGCGWALVMEDRNAPWPVRKDTLY
jgi:hypothetical protein